MQQCLSKHTNQQHTHMLSICRLPLGLGSLLIEACRSCLGVWSLLKAAARAHICANPSAIRHMSTQREHPSATRLSLPEQYLHPGFNYRCVRVCGCARVCVCARACVRARRKLEVFCSRTHPPILPCSVNNPSATSFFLSLRFHLLQYFVLRESRALTGPSSVSGATLVHLS